MFVKGIPNGFFSLGCFPFNNGQIAYAWAYWVPQLVSESTLFFMTLPKTISILRGPTKTPHFTYVLLVDSFVYFGGVVAIILLNFIIWLLPSVSVTSFHIVLSTFPSSPAVEKLLRVQCGPVWALVFFLPRIFFLMFLFVYNVLLQTNQLLTTFVGYVNLILTLGRGRIVLPPFDILTC